MGDRRGMGEDNGAGCGPRDGSREHDDDFLPQGTQRTAENGGAARDGLNTKRRRREEPRRMASFYRRGCWEAMSGRRSAFSGQPRYAGPVP